MLNKVKTDNDAVFAAENSMAAEFKAKYGIDAPPGAAIRELAIRPAAVLRALEEDWRDELVDSLNMFKVANGEEEGDDDLVDAIASIYRLKRKGSTASTGTLLIEVADVQTVYINSSVGFRIDSTILTVPGVYVGHAGNVPSTTADGVTHAPIRKYTKGVDDNGDPVYSYCIIVPVMCESGSNYPSGTEVTVVGPAGDIKGASVFSAITGGGSTESNQSLAKRLLEGMPPGVMSTPLQIKNTFAENFGVDPSRTTVLGSADGTVRSKDFITGLHVPGNVDICVAPAGDCPHDVIEVTTEIVTTGVRSITLDNEKAAGVYDVVQLFINGEERRGFEVVYTPDTNTTHAINSDCYRFSSYQKIVITFENDVEITSATVVVRRQNSVQAMQAFVDSSETRAPGQDVVVYAATPVFLKMSLATEGVDISDDIIRTTICNHFNSLPVGRSYISAQDCFDALKPLGVKVVFPITFYAHIITNNGEHDIMSVNGRLDYGTFTGGCGVVYVAADDVRVVAG